MPDIDIGGEYEGVAGKFKWRGSFPVIISPCDHLIDKITLKKIPIYIMLHGGSDGKPQMSCIPAELRKDNDDEYRRD